MSLLNQRIHNMTNKLLIIFLLVCGCFLSVSCSIATPELSDSDCREAQAANLTPEEGNNPVTVDKGDASRAEYSPAKVTSLSAESMGNTDDRRLRIDIYLENGIVYLWMVNYKKTILGWQHYWTTVDVQGIRFEVQTSAGTVCASFGPLSMQKWAKSERYILLAVGNDAYSFKSCYLNATNTGIGNAFAVIDYIEPEPTPAPTLDPCAGAYSDGYTDGINFGKSGQAMDNYYDYSNPCAQYNQGFWDGFYYAVGARY
jgi:hypothetical protein